MSPKTKEKRQKLSEISRAVKPLVKMGVYSSVNDALISQYCEAEGLPANEFKTFIGWKKEGKYVKKGESAFLIWGRPKNIKVEKEDSEEEESFDYFPLAYLFSSKQVASYTEES